MGQGKAAASKQEEQVIRARPVSRGVAIGRAVPLHGRKLHFFKAHIPAKQAPKELKRFANAVELAKRNIEKFHKAKTSVGKEIDAAGVLLTQKFFLEDAELRSKIEAVIQESKVNAEWAVKVVTDGYIKELKSANDELIRAKYLDLEDAAERLITALGSGKKEMLKVPAGSIVVAKELNPSALIELSESRIKGIITERGGWTSHTFILARELSLPAVTGVKHALRRINNGEKVLVDGNRGLVITNPGKASIESDGRPRKTGLPPLQAKKEKSDELRTLDGRRINILANVDTAELYERARKFGAKGIGLFRSEFLFNAHSGYPDEELQVKAYSKIARSVGSAGVNIRTFDLTASQLPDFHFEEENNPALGLRAIRLSLVQKRYFRIQLRSILRASKVGRILVCLPMVSDVSEIAAAKKLLQQERKKLEKAGIETEMPPIGVMIEVPAAILTIDEICAEVDFLCLGTNDLVQYLLAADRDNESIADVFRTLHPAVVRAVKSVIDAAARDRKRLIVCGEMAGSPFYLPVLVGLGADTFSMNVNSIERIVQTVKGIAFEEAVEVGSRIRECKTADAAEGFLKKYIKTHWAHAIDLAALPGDRRER